MPFLKESQQIPSAGLYDFADEQKAMWKKFWINMDGDMDKIIAFAKDLGVETPKEWFEELHRFLFDLYYGKDKIYRKEYKKEAAANTFQKYLKDICEIHKESPKDNWWYAKKNLDYTNFLRLIEKASQFEDYKQAINHINSHVPDFGSKIHSEWMLTHAPEAGELKSIATKKYKEAVALENEILGKEQFSIGDKVNYFGFTGELTITNIVSSDVKKISFRDLAEGNFSNYILCQDSKGITHKIVDFDLVSKV